MRMRMLLLSQPSSLALPGLKLSSFFTSEGVRLSSLLTSEGDIGSSSSIVWNWQHGQVGLVLVAWVAASHARIQKNVLCHVSYRLYTMVRFLNWCFSGNGVVFSVFHGWKEETLVLIFYLVFMGCWCFCCEKGKIRPNHKVNRNTKYWVFYWSRNGHNILKHPDVFICWSAMHFSG